MFGSMLLSCCGHEASTVDKIPRKTVSSDAGTLISSYLSSHKTEHSNDKKFSIPTQIVVNTEDFQEGRDDDLEVSIYPAQEVRGNQEEMKPFRDRSSRSTSSDGRSYSSPVPPPRTKLEELRRRDFSIGLKRREEIANARKHYQQGVVKYVTPKVRSASEYGDSGSLSSSTSRKYPTNSASSSLLNGKLIKVYYQQISNEHFKSPSTVVTTMSCSTSSRSSNAGSSLSNFTERDRLIAASRREAILTARAKTNSTRTLPSRSTSKPRHLQKERETREEKRQARFDRLYEQGKAKNRAVLAKLSHFGDQNVRRKRSSSLSLKASKSKRIDAKHARSPSPMAM